MRQFLRRLFYILRSRHDDDLASEIAFHREMRQRELESHGFAVVVNGAQSRSRVASHRSAL
jgi:hypothetical protein